MEGNGKLPVCSGCCAEPLRLLELAGTAWKARGAVEVEIDERLDGGDGVVPVARATASLSSGERERATRLR